MALIDVQFGVNGRAVGVTVPAERTLLDVLRDELGLTGAKEGCSEGECGACTVLLDGQPVTSCLVLAGQVDGCEVVTIEGLASSDGTLHPLQAAFVEVGAVQCGYCIPGMIVSGASLLERRDDPTEAEIAEGLGGNFCRCTGYNKIFEAIRLAASRMELRP